MYFDNDWAVVVPMANEEKEFMPFVNELRAVIDRMGSGKVYFVVDTVSQDKTLDLCRFVSNQNARFETIWAPENRNIVDAYLKGYQVAYENGHTHIIEMDAGMSHDPRALPMFLRVLAEGNECVFGSRFINGSSMTDSNFRRRFLSKWGTILSNYMLGTHMKDMTSGYQGFHRDVVKLFLKHSFRSNAHFYQTELRYLLRKKRYVEIPIHYRAPSPSVSSSSVLNSIYVLLYYSYLRFIGQPTMF